MNEVRITWNVSLPLPSDTQLRIRNVLLPDVDFTDSKNSNHKDLSDMSMTVHNHNTDHTTCITEQ